MAWLVFPQSPILFCLGRLQVRVTQAGSDGSALRSGCSSLLAGTGGPGGTTGAGGTGGTPLSSLFDSLTVCDSATSPASLLRLLSLDLRRKIIFHLKTFPPQFPHLAGGAGGLLRGLGIPLTPLTPLTPDPTGVLSLLLSGCCPF